MSEIIKQCWGGGPWAIRPFDLKDAYRQCGVSLSSTPFAHIAGRNRETGRASIFRMLALPFWEREVGAFVSQSCPQRLVCLNPLPFSALATNCFDDLVVVSTIRIKAYNCRDSWAAEASWLVVCRIRFKGAGL